MQSVYSCLGICWMILCLASCGQPTPPTASPAPAEKDEKSPFDWMYHQRAYPDNFIDHEAYLDAIAQTKRARQGNPARDPEDWVNVGPTNIGGRFNAIALHPVDTNIIYGGSAVGGIFKTINGGTSWFPIFDEVGIPSIGDIAMAPSDPEVLYVATGDANGGASSGAFPGAGVWRTEDGGQSWEARGLELTQQIGRMVIHPDDANLVYAAAAGKLYGKGNNRGIYRSADGGQNWEQVLFVSDSTATIDLTMDGQNPDILYASTWERIRFPWQRRYGGPSSGIWRSTDGGDNWTRLTGGLPAPADTIGRIGIATSPAQPGLVMAVYTKNPITNRFMGVYRSEDYGDNWTQTDTSSYLADAFSSFGWFFSNIRISPHDANDNFVLGLRINRSNDEGVTWYESSPGVHVDQHDLAFHPMYPNFMVAANDGGLYISHDGGMSWEHMDNIPNTQFYQIALDDKIPERVMGGTQDNNSIQTFSDDPGAYNRILGGDGFYIMVPPDSNNYLFAEYQWGNLFRSDNFGEGMEYIFFGEDDRTNWNTPYTIDPNTPTTMYYGSSRVWQSLDRGDTWLPISEDLTNGPHPSGSLSYGTLTVLSVAQADSDVLYTGSDDGNVHVTFDGGENWANISGDLPNRFVTAIAIAPNNPDEVIVTFSGYRKDDYLPHVWQSFDGGQNWTDISGNLPEIPVNDLVIDPFHEGVYYLANDLAVWYTLDGGANWQLAGDNMPLTVINDLALTTDGVRLYAGTFGRSIYYLDVTSLIVNTDEPAVAENDFLVYPNPVDNGRLEVQFNQMPAAEQRLELRSISGQLLRQYQVREQQFTLATNELAAGLYLLVWTDGQKQVARKFVVQ